MPPIRTQLSVGSFFSGIDVPVLCLSDLIGKENVDHSFSVELDKVSAKLILKSFAPRHFVKDATDTRSILELPFVDICWISPPCKDYSSNGLCAGVRGTKGLLVFNALSYVSHMQPAIVVIEQVVGSLRKMHKKNVA